MRELNHDLLQPVISLCREAGEKILEVYRADDDFGIQVKDDNSPVTKADLAAHALLEPGLAALLPGVPVLSEESDFPDYAERKHWQRYWLVDPLDGTKEFINRNDEFTVNVALIEGNQAVLGVVYVPVLDVLYSGIAGLGAWKTTHQHTRPIQVRSVASRLLQQLPVELVASRRHGTEAANALMTRIEADLGEVATKSMGSSLKLCLVAEGEADLYPRLAPTCEWDTAAAQAVVEAAGGQVLDAELKPLRYNTKSDLLNPDFYVIGDSQYRWKALLITQ